MDKVIIQTLDDKKNFKNDGLEVCVLDDYIYEKHTSLGGDDGIALVYCFVLLASDTLSYPRLEVVFTIDEEVRMDLAREIDLPYLQEKKLINLDS